MERTDPLYVDALRFLLDRVNFEKTVDQPYDHQSYRLARMAFLLEQLGNPQYAAPVIHIAGTKGKGSVAWLLAESLRMAGVACGLYTSPHLNHLEERLIVQGVPVPPEVLVAEIPRLRDASLRCSASHHGEPTFFELTTALAWCIFQSSRTACNVIEVGLGGRLDSTNVCSPCLTLITSISYDHQQQLGEQIAQIAFEKAGIIKPGVPILHACRNEEARSVIQRVARERNAELWEIGKDFEAALDLHPHSHDEFQNPSRDPNPSSNSQGLTFRRLNDRLPPGEFGPLKLRMLGRHQADNAALAVAAWIRLGLDGWELPSMGLVHALAETQVPARVELVGCRPWIIIDAAHNEASIDALLQTLTECFSPNRKTILFACSKDKKYPEMLRRLLGYADRLILTQYQCNPRYVPVEKLEQIAKSIQSGSQHPTQIFSAPDVGTAIDYARRESQDHDLICVTGSFFTAAEAKQHLAKRPSTGEDRSA